MTKAKRLRSGDYVQGENLGENWVIAQVIEADKKNGSVKVGDKDGGEHTLIVGETYKATKDEFEAFTYEEPAEEPEVSAQVPTAVSGKNYSNAVIADEHRVKGEPFGMAWINEQNKIFFEPRLIKRGKKAGKLEIQYKKSVNNPRKKVIIKVSDVTEWYVDKEEILNPNTEVDEVSGDDDSVKIRPKWDRYTTHDIKTESGRRTINIADEVATLLQGNHVEQCYIIVADKLAAIEADAINEADLRARYCHLNKGMQRMNLGNRLRAALKRNGIKSLSEV